MLHLAFVLLFQGHDFVEVVLALSQLRLLQLLELLVLVLAVRVQVLGLVLQHQFTVILMSAWCHATELSCV